MKPATTEDRLVRCLELLGKLNQAFAEALEDHRAGKLDISKINRETIESMLDRVSTESVIVRLDEGPPSKPDRKTEKAGLLAEGLTVADKLAHNWAAANEIYQSGGDPDQVLLMVDPKITRDIATRICDLSELIVEND